MKNLYILKTNFWDLWHQNCLELQLVIEDYHLILNVYLLYKHFHFASSIHSQLVEEPETIEQRAVAAAAPVETLRFSVISTDSGVHGENNDNNLTSITVGQKVGESFFFFPKMKCLIVYL